jgi:aspartyl-tRNA synthetase
MLNLYSPEEMLTMEGKEVDICGWVHDVRRLGGISFILIRNSKGIFQITVKKDSGRELIEKAGKLRQEDVILCRGEVRKSEIARNGFEVFPKRIDVISKSDTPLPLDPRGVVESHIDTRFEWRSIDLRTEKMHAVFYITNIAVNAMEEYLQKNGFIRVFTPSIIGGISEGGAEVFKIDYFGKPAFLRQDPQLHRQLTIAGGFERIYDLGTNWRAELSHTPRHLCEHRTIAPEIAFIDDERDVMKVEEEMVIHAIKAICERCSKQLSTLKLKLTVPESPFPELRFPEIYSILKSMGKEKERNEDLDTESLKLLSAYVKKEYNSEFFFINRFPYSIKPFYVMKVEEDPDYARSVDLMFGSTELSSGGQREHRYEKLVEQIREKGIDEKLLSWFTEPFRYGVPPHGGYSFGIERFIASILNLENVKEASLFPRDPERLLP